MATAKAQTSDWRERARDLAVARYLNGTAMWRGMEQGMHRWEVPSRSGKASHTVYSGGCLDHPRCDCAAGQYNRPCSHVGAVLHTIEIAQKAHDDPFLTFSITGEW